MFTTFFYNYGGFIELNEYGGYVNITNVTVSDLNGCGSFIRNKRGIFRRYITVNSYPTSYTERNNNLQNELYNYLKNKASGITPYSGCVPNTETVPGLPLCFSLNIVNSSFTRVGYALVPNSHHSQVDPSLNMRYVGTVI